MKKSSYLLLAAGTVLLASCDLDAPNQSTMSEADVFSTEELADAAVMGIHQSFGETNSYRGRFVPYFGTNTDCEIFNNYGGVADPMLDKEASLACYNAQIDNSYMNTSTNAWAKLYEGIERANKAVEGMLGNADLTNTNMRQLYGELLTLRGMIYFDLVKAWGDVPYRFSPITSDELYLPQTDRAIVLKKVMDDLLEAEDYLGWPNQNEYTKSTERVSKAFAKGLRARIALFLAGQSEDVSGTALRYNLSDASERQQMYQIAYDECVSVIEAGYNKLGAFDTNFRNLSADITTAGLESLYEIPFSEGRGRVLYTWGGKHSTTDDWTKLAKGGVNGPAPTLWYDYDPEDIRRDITCLPYQWTDGAKTISNTSGGGWSFGKLRFEWMSRVVTSSNDDGVNFQVMRLADVYMMAAEAANELNLSSAATYLRPVMERAYPKAVVEAKLAAASSKDAFFNLLVDERKFEFAGEAIRKVDLMRWGLLSTKLAELKQNMTDLANRQGKYADYARKVYYNEGLDAAKTDADFYFVYGLEQGNSDEMGKVFGLSKSSQLFCFYTDEEMAEVADDKDKTSSYTTNNNKIQKMIDYLYIKDPNSRMFWPIWSYFINSSNGQLVNYYGY